MRLQTSIEFILLMAAVAGFGVTMLMVYGQMAHMQEGILAGMAGTANAIQSSNALPSASPQYSGPYIELPSVTYVNKSNVLLVAFSGANTTLQYVNASAPGAVLEPSTYKQVGINGLEVLGFAFVPAAPGPYTIKVGYAAAGDSADLVNTSTYAVYAPANSTPQTAQYSAAVDALSELLLFNLSSGTPTYTVTESSHCSDLNWWGQQLSISQQCGNAKWYYWMFSGSCYYSANPVMTSTTCVYLNPQSASIAGLASAPFKDFNITLLLYNSSAELHANLSSSASASGIYSQAGAFYGNAVVSGGISYTGPSPTGYVVRLYNGADALLNQTVYYPYEQAYTNLLSTLSYYNNTSVGDSTPIQEAISAYNSASQAITRAAPTTMQGCNFTASGRALACQPYAPFQFSNITLYMNSKNQTLLTQGSTINIR